MSAVSVVIPNYNHTRYLGGAVQSVISQTYQDIEIIVVDDGSTDGCAEVVSGFGGRVRYMRQENQGLAGARNTGIRAASGELVGLLDADDQWLPGFLERMVSVALLHPNAAAYFCSARGMDESSHDLPQVFGRAPHSRDGLYATLLRASFIIPSTTVVRRDAVVAAGLFDQSLRSCEDLDLWLRLLATHEVIGAPECLVRYRVHDNTLSARADSMRKAIRAVVEKHFGSENGEAKDWSTVKRRAYGGLYRYYALTALLREHDWQAATFYLSRAFLADPSLSRDLDFFYDLALGEQPTGYRGTSHGLDLRSNAARLANMLDEVFCRSRDPRIRCLNRRARGTAYYAVGLLAYNTGQLSLSLQCMRKAVRFLPSLVCDRKVASLFIKTALGPSNLNRLRRLRAQAG
ncbi:MAG: glycosyltransferase family 2 protein [Acidobacteriales bacterium]|nr:glycosyltransferase family 2 protein [Terriglobales bacterium]